VCRERQDTRDPLTSRDDPGIGGEGCNRENHRSREKRNGGSSRVEQYKSTEEERPDNGAQTYEGGSHLLPRFYGVPYRADHNAEAAFGSTLLRFSLMPATELKTAIEARPAVTKQLYRTAASILDSVFSSIFIKTANGNAV
jgi:hypothetical protein